MNTNAMEKAPALEIEGENAGKTAPQDDSTTIAASRLRPDFVTIKNQIRLPDGQTSMACGIIFMAAVLFWRVIKACGYGFEPTDEAYYLISMQSPHLYDSSITKFGAVYHPLYELLGGNIFFLRVFDTILKYILAFLLAYLVLAENIRSLDKKDTAWAVIAGIATVSCMQNLHEQSWMGAMPSWMSATPSYNSLNFEALLICMIGVVLATSESFFKKYFGAFVIGLGCTLCFLSKPTSSLLLFICLFFYFFLISKERFKLLSVIYITSAVFMLISMCIISGTPYKFVIGLINGYYDTLSLQSGHSFIKGLEHFINLPSITLQDALLFVLAVSFMLLLAVCQKTKKTSASVVVFACAASSFFIMSPERTQSIQQPDYFYITFAGFLLFAVLFASKKWKEGSIRPQTSVLALSLLLFVMPAIYVFGTNTGYWWSANKVLVFPIIGTIVAFKLLPAKQLWNLALSFIMSVILFITIPIAYSQYAPYRQDAPIYKQKTFMRIGGGRLKLAEVTASYIEYVQSQAQQGGVVSGIPIIDLAGYGPGMLYVLGAEAVGTPWILGGYSGRLDTATRQLQRVPREKLLRSWVLTNHNDEQRQSIPDEIFVRLNLNFPDGYEKRAEWYCGELPCELYAPKEVDLKKN